MDIYHFEIISGSMTRNGNQPKCQFAAYLRRIVGLDCSQLVLLWFWLVLDVLGRSWVGLVFSLVFFLVFVLSCRLLLPHTFWKTKLCFIRFLSQLFADCQHAPPLLTSIGGGSYDAPQRDPCSRRAGQFPFLDAAGVALDDGEDLSTCRWPCISLDAGEDLSTRR
jgi:hypothetical protein